MEDREAHLARLRELSTAQRTRALTSEELREVARHFRAIGDEQRATAAERAAAGAVPAALPAAAAPDGYLDDPASVDHRQIITRVHTLTFATRDIELKGTKAEDVMSRARSGTNTYPRMLKRFGELVSEEFLPALPLPRRCAICSNAEIAATLTEQAPARLKLSLTIYSLAALNAQFLDLNNVVDSKAMLAWPLCAACRDAVAARLLALSQIRSRLLDARKAARPLGALMGGKRRKAEFYAVEALRQVGFPPFVLDCYDLPRVVQLASDVRYSEVGGVGQASRTVEFAVGNQKLVDELEDAAPARRWMQTQVAGSRAVSVFQVALDLADRLGSYRLAEPTN